jgi:hypothetical protein
MFEAIRFNLQRECVIGHMDGDVDTKLLVDHSILINHSLDI